MDYSTQEIAPILAFAKPPWPSRHQLIREAHEFSYRLKVNPPGAQHFGLVSFMLIVLLPVLLAIIYFYFVAVDQYSAEARLVVRSLRDKSLASDIGPPKIARSPLSPFVSDNRNIRGDSGSGGSNSGLSDQSTPRATSSGSTLGRLAGLGDPGSDRAVAIDAYVLSNFLNSRNLVAALDSDHMLRTIYSRREADWLARFNASGSTEALWRYWQGKITASIDSLTGIITLRVVAFRPDDALAITNAVIKASRDLLDDYSHTIQRDAVKNARQTLEETADRYQQALIALRDSRNVDRVINPVEATGQKLKALVTLGTERARAERDEWVSARVTSPDSTVTHLLQDRVASLTQQINKLQDDLTQQKQNAGTESVAIGRYRDLELTRAFAERSYAMAQTAYEHARFEAEYKGLTLAVFLPPQKPEIALYPRRMVDIVLVFAVAMIIWAMFRLAASGITEYLVLRR